MNVLTSRWRRWSALAAASVAMLLVLTSCQGSGPNPATNSGGANNSNNPELFTIPQDQMSHVQVLPGTAHDADSIPTADWSSGLQQLSHDPGYYPGEWTGQQGSGRSRAESNSGRAHVVRGES